nr:platelet binding protein GspB isoform X1 [Nothobranchius furzeri]
MAASPHLPADDDVSQSFGETSRCSEVWKQSGPKTDDWDRKQAQKESLQLQFQESHLSPSLSLLPVASGEELSFTEPSFFQQSDSEFAPLRAYPDISVASERLCVPLQDQTNHWSEPSLLSQHPLAQATILSEEGTNTLSEHILSPGIKNKEEKKARPHQKAATATGQGLWREGTGHQEGELETLTEVTDKNFRDVFQDDISFLNNDVPAQHLLDLLQKEVGMQSSSSSSISSASQSSEKRTGSLMDDSKRTQTSKAITDQSLATREHPPGEASLHQQQTRPSEVRNITMGSRSTQPDDSSELLHTELLAEAHRLGDLEAESKNKQQKAEMQSCQFSASLLKEESERRPRGKAGLGSVQRMAPFLAATDWVRREQELLLSQSKTEIDGSYLGFLPQSQSTPGVFMAQMKTTLGQLSAIKSDKNATYQSVTPQPAVSKMDICFPDQLRQSKDGSVQTSAEVQSLPSLNFRQKVDAWRTKPTPVSGFSSPDPGGSGLTLNRTITPQAGTSLRLSATGAAQLNVPQNGSLALSGSSSPRRGEAVRGGPGDKISGGSAAPPIASPLGRSQSHSSLSTVITSVCKHQHPDVPPEEEQSHNRDHAPQSPGTSVHPSSLTGLGRFSDVSPDQVLTCSSSQDSCGGTKVGASVGTSSVVSLELDNYAPYWTSKSTPPPPSKPQELNIDERIPLYLYILGVDQSPSNILTPFAPRDPTREPEFSPTDLCTIKGSTGTPSKGTQASEDKSAAVAQSSSHPLSSCGTLVGNSPQKGEFSRSSLLSADSSISVPFSLDSLGPAVPVPQQVGVRTSLPSGVEAAQSEGRVSPSSQPPTQQAVSQLANMADVSLTTKAGVAEKKPDSPSQSSQGMTQDAEKSFVSLKESEIRRLLSQTENIVITGSAPHRLRSDEDIFSSTAGDLITRSSSDSMLISQKTKQTSLQPDNSSSQNLTVSSPATVTPNVAPDRAVSRPGTTLSVSISARRTEPEGCSAAPADKLHPQQQVTMPSPAASMQQLYPEVGETPTPAQNHSSSSVAHDNNQEAMSDGSSESSLAVRVAKLLQTESPDSVMSSTPSAADQEERRPKKRLQLCEPLELDIKDRRCIEDIKKELLRNPTESQESTDTESSSSSHRVHKENNHSAEMCSSDSDNHLEQPAALTQPQSPAHSHLEARVREIAAREGVTLPSASITVSTHRHPPSPPLSPATPPLGLMELLTEPGRPTGAKLLAADPNQQEVGSAQTASREPSPVFGERSSVRQGDHRVTAQPASRNRKRWDTMGGQPETSLEPSQDMQRFSHLKALSHLTGSGHTGPSSVSSTARTGNVSHVHLSPSPKPPDHLSVSPVLSTHPDTVSGLPRQDFSFPREFASAVGLSRLPEQSNSRQPVGRDTPALYEQVSQEKSTLSFPPQLRAEVVPRTVSAEAAAPVLLPYKPRGSDELFYVPQTEADVSSADTTMESTHTGSDDAVPPHFSSQVLGKQDPGLDRGVSFRHPEGIYSKRLQMAGSEHTADGSLPAVSRAPTSSFQASATRSPSAIHQKVSLSRDQGTSPVQFLPYKQTDPGGVHPAYRETIPTFVPQKRHLEPQQSSRTMDQMWKWTMESSRPTRDREALLLEHLSHLLHHMEADDPGVQERRDPDPEEQLSRTQRRRATVRRDVGLQVEATLQPEQEAGHAPFSHSSSQSHRLSPVDREGTSSTVSSSVSTVDTTRLVRAFGAHRVQQLKSSSSLRKLYCSISRQRRGNLTNPPHDLTPSEPTRSEGSVAPDSGSSSSWFPSHHGPSTALTAKRTVKLANKSVQAGDLEIVKNGTRRHTRDVGTTFPSPGETRALGQISSSPSLAVRGRRRQKSPKPHKKIKPVPKGVSWFISAESLKSETKKENRPEGSTAGRLSTAWFEPYRTLRLWKEPLRQIYEDNQSCSGEPDPDPKTRTMSSGLTRVSLQEALEMRCPGFISRSRQRLRRLALRAEERKLHAVLSRDTNLVFNQRGGPVKLPKPAGTGLLLRAVPRREMIQRSKQMYENLPEVQRRREEERRRAEYQVYRLNARLYNKRITNRVLGRREAWH